MTAGPVNIVAPLSGQAGGAGGTGGVGLVTAGGGGGGGGSGGHGLVLSGVGSSFNSSTITGGAGGAGGEFGGVSQNCVQCPAGVAGNGGDGGAGVSVLVPLVVLTNSGTITGGNGGPTFRPDVGGIFGLPGGAGAGVVGSSLTVNNSGTIAAGNGGAGIAINFTGGANTLNLQPGWALNGSINVEGSLTFNQSGNVTLPNGITGGGSVIQNGIGTLTLTGANSYTGSTSITAGSTLALSGSGSIRLSSGVTLATGAVFDISAVTGPGTRIASLAGTGGTVTLGANTLTLYASSGTFGGAINGTGGLEISGGTQTLTGSNGYTGATTIDVGEALALSGGGSIAASSGVDMQRASHFDISGATGPAVTIKSLSGECCAVLPTVNLGANTLTLSNASGTFTGVIDGTGGLRVTAGTETLTGSNGYTGATTIDGGTLALSGAGSIAASSGVTLAPGAFFDISNSAGGGATIKSLAGTAGTVTLGAKTLTLSNASGTFGGAITGSGGLTLAAGTQTLTGTSTYTGATTINGGTLALSGAGSIAASSGVTLAPGAFFDISNSTGGGATIKSLAGTGGTVTLGANTLTLSAAAFSTFGGDINGTGGLTLAAGTQELTGNNGYTGATTISGALFGRSANTFSAASATTINTGGGLSLGGVAQTINAVSLAGGTLQDGSLTGAITSTGGRIDNIGGSATVTANSGTTVLSTILGLNSYTGNTTVSNGATLLGDNANAFSAGSATTINPGGNVNLGGFAQTITAVSLAGGTIQNGSLTGAITSTGGAINGIAGSATVTGNSGITVLTGTNAYSGATIVNNAATLSGGSANAFSAASATTINTGGTVDLGGFAQTMNTVSLAGGTIQNGSLTGTITSTGGAINNIGGTAALMANGGITTLAGTNTYSGGTTVTAGTLQGNATSLQGNIVNNAAVVFDQAANGTYAGILSGTGTLTKTNAGALTLTGANTYSGGTTVTAGTLQGNTTSLQGNIVNNAAVVFDQPANGTYAGILSGTGTLTKTNAGALTLTGANTYSGNTTVNGGMLVVNGSIVSPVTVNAGGLLGGTGTIGGANIMAGGIFAPGNSIGTMTVNGNVSFAAGSTFRVEVDAAGNADRINATGTATLSGGTVDVQAGAGTYRPISNYTILNATGGVTGAFTNVTSNLAFLTPSLSYGPNDVFLKLERNDVSFASVAATPNQQAVATVLQASVAGASGDLETVLNTLTGLSAGQAQVAFQSIGGVSLVAVRRAGEAFAGGFSQQLNRRLVAVGSDDTPARSATFSPLQVAANNGIGDARPIYAQAGAPSGADDPATRGGRGFWIRGYGVGSDTDGDSNAAENRLRGGGVSVGADGTFGEGLVLGVAATYGVSHVSFDGLPGSGRARGMALGAYGEYAAAPWTLRAIAGVAWSDNHMDRVIVFGGPARAASSDFDSNSPYAYLEATYDLKMHGYGVQPIAALSYVKTKNDGFTESGAGALNLQVREQTTHSTRSLLGVKTTHGVGIVTLEPRGLWAHEFGNVNAPMTANLAGAPVAGNFTVSGVELKRDSLVLGLGASGAVAKNVTLFADAQAEGNSRQRNFGVFAGVRGVW
jgi:fibronectin-binding autotransporter adhesin